MTISKIIIACALSLGVGLGTGWALRPSTPAGAVAEVRRNQGQQPTDAGAIRFHSGFQPMM
ncbi:MAG TPA: hypothetical protein VHZ99_03385 [Steroidobacteraceae bacterium]|jgi:hypothetical protein|nr:hypothetical protein [Steroidobacteraceae bacterium]